VKRLITKGLCWILYPSPMKNWIKKCFAVIPAPSLAMGIFLGQMAFAVGLPLTPSPGGPASVSQNSTFDAQIAQNTQKALQTFSGVKSSNFLKETDTDFAGFASQNDSGKQEFPVDLAAQGNPSVDDAMGNEISTDQDAIDTKIEGDWTHD
jgi:hypothetical protein